MAKKDSQPHWMLTLMVAVLPALIAGWFSVRAADKADQSTAQSQKTADELAISYQLMKQALEMVQHESDAYRDSLQHTTDLLVKLLQHRRQPTAEETELLGEAQRINQALVVQPSPRPHLPPSLHDVMTKGPGVH